MAHHKRGKRKNARSGCRLCKPHKSNGVRNSVESKTWQERRARVTEREWRQEVAHGRLEA